MNYLEKTNYHLQKDIRKYLALFLKGVNIVVFRNMNNPILVSGNYSETDYCTGMPILKPSSVTLIGYVATFGQLPFASTPDPRSKI